MKKFFENKYFDHIFKTLIALLVGWSAILLVNIYHFIKYEQPYKDEKQNEAIGLVKIELNKCYEIIYEKNSYVHKRIDNQEEDIEEINKAQAEFCRKQDIIIYEIKRRNGYKDLLTKTE